MELKCVRKCFIPQEGNYLYQLDFSQMELRLMAEFSQDEVMIDAYVNGRDIHAITASKVLKISLDEFYALDPKKQKEYRTQAKAVNFGFCMAGDTKVPTKDGLVRLDSIKVGQEVLTAFGNWGEVTQTFKRTVDTTLEITTRGGKTVIVTPEHMMLVYFPAANGLKGKHGWVEARRLDVGDYLTFVNAERHHAEVDLWANDLARIAGWYLAEGCRHNSGIKITQSFQANSDVYGEMNRVLPKYGFTPFTDLTGFYIKAENFKVLEKMLHVNFDNHSKDKILDIPIERLSYNDKINLLAGLWDGDGCVTTSNHRLTISYSSISISLLEYIKEVLETLGINSKIYDYKKSNGAIQLHIMGTESRKIFWEKIPTIKLNRIPPYNPKKSFDATEKIVSIKELKENIEVFDITVKGDHSFIANGLASHNCYGMGAYAYVGYSKNTYGIEVSLEAAENMRNAFFDTYKRLPDYHAEYVQKASKYGWVRTLFGRRRRTPDINSDDGMRSSMDERVSINSPIQGTGGEITLFVIALLQHRLDPRVKLVNTVHDSIMYDVPPELLDETVRICTETCENAPMLMYFGRELKKVTLKIDSEVSTTNWRELRPYEINQK